MGSYICPLWPLILTRLHFCVACICMKLSGSLIVQCLNNFRSRSRKKVCLGIDSAYVLPIPRDCLHSLSVCMPGHSILLSTCLVFLGCLLGTSPVVYVCLSCLSCPGFPDKHACTHFYLYAYLFVVPWLSTSVMHICISIPFWLMTLIYREFECLITLELYARL